MKVKALENTKNIYDSVRNVMFTPGEVFEASEERYEQLKNYVEKVEEEKKTRGKKSAK